MNNQNKINNKFNDRYENWTGVKKVAMNSSELILYVPNEIKDTHGKDIH